MSVGGSQSCPARGEIAATISAAGRLPQGFEELVRRLRPPLVRFASRFVGFADAEDVVQEALLRAYAELASGRELDWMRPWLFTTVRNRALNVLRDRRPTEPLDEQIDGVAQPQQIAEARQRLIVLIEEVQRLPTAQRRALVGRELEGRTHAEIAASLGCSRGAVRGLIYRARTRLRDQAG